jgi:membrane fusion protein, copper/silver efflux system
MPSRKAVLSTLFIAVVLLAGCTSRPPASATSSPPQAQAAVTYTCPMHPGYRSDHPGDCPMCGMRLVPVSSIEGAANGASASKDGPGLVRVSGEKQQLIGVRTDEVDPASASQLVLRVPGRVAVDEQRLYRITAAVDGWIRQLGDNPAGSFVRKQQVLATYYAQNLISAVQTYVFALQTNAQSLSGDATIGYQRGTTQLSLQVALDSLRALGMSEFQIKEIERTRLAPTDILVYSPINGFVTARNITPEQRFDKGTELYQIADIGHVWVMAEIFERDSGFLKPGTRATVIYQGRRLEARMSDALPQFDAQTRTLKTRFELDNPGDILRPDMFVDVELHVEMPAALTVPTDAVVDSGVRKTVYVSRGDGYFEARRVETGWRVGDRVQVVKGLMPGERVVVSGNFLLDSESRMKSAAMGIYNPETDPVCGMEVDHDAARNAGRAVTHGGSTYFFCSDDCKHKFEADPGKYTESGKAESGQAAAEPMNGARPAGGMAGMKGMTGMAGTAAAPQVSPAKQAAAATVKDVVCGMNVDPKDAAAAGRTIEYNGTTYYFCSEDCKTKFKTEPTKYVKQGRSTK